jgi:hypothetical protein
MGQLVASDFNRIQGAVQEAGLLGGILLLINVSSNKYFAALPYWPQTVSAKTVCTKDRCSYIRIVTENAQKSTKNNGKCRKIQFLAENTENNRIFQKNKAEKLCIIYS